MIKVKLRSQCTLNLTNDAGKIYVEVIFGTITCIKKYEKQISGRVIKIFSR